MQELRYLTEFNVGAEVVFAALCAHEEVPHWWAGLMSLHGSADRGVEVGARYSGRLRLGARVWFGTWEITGLRPSEFLRLTCVPDGRADIAWTLVPASKDRTLLECRFGYRFRGGRLGSVAERIARPLIARMVAESICTLRDRVAAQRASA
ncbi:SRPBCC family protein [Nocardia sp. NPDC058379]|uniref:SRPBCC family protein n=1 Tax=unclassified Nocardia TaxID=2637762 RepID=UPI0036526029